MDIGNMIEKRERFSKIKLLSKKNNATREQNIRIKLRFCNSLCYGMVNIQNNKRPEALAKSRESCMHI